MASPTSRRGIILLLSALLLAAAGPPFVDNFTPDPQDGIDFFQDWSSARNWREGVPIYEDLRLTADRYIGRRFAPDEELAVPKNAHPPTSVLVTLPFAWFGYPAATTLWNVLSIVCLAIAVVATGRALGFTMPAWWIVPAAALAVTCNPLRHQVEMGQINGVLLALLVGTWLAERNERPATAGLLLALATTVKLTPGLLFVYYLIRRRWSLLVWGVAAGAALTLATAAVLGIDAYLSYLKEVLPLSSRYTPMRMNASLSGLWTKLFDAGVVSHLTVRQVAPPLVHAPLVARIGHIVSAALVLFYSARVALAVNSRGQADVATAVWVTAMLLLSPATWDHSLLLAVLPLAVLWPHVADDRRRRMLYAVLITIMWISPTAVWNAFEPLGSTARWIPALSSCLQGLALVGLFVMLIGAAAPTPASSRPASAPV